MGDVLIARNMALIYLALAIGVLIILFLSAKLFFLVKRLLWKRKNTGLYSVGFFHPYCDAGGGGERVLWCAIRAVQNRYKNVHCIVFTGDSSSGTAILKKVESNFNIKFPKSVEFIHLKCRSLTEAKNYPYFTLLLQSLASCILGLEAAVKHVPDIYIDTMGYAWTYPIFKHLCSCRIGAYVHYPTISTDMLSSVSEQKVTVNNREFISKSRILSYVKVIYYKIFAFLYGLMGRQSEVIMVNSSWTQNHILELWKRPESTYIVYPPCDVSVFDTLPLRSDLDRKNLRIISIAQFRPEKNHKLQLNAFKVFLDRFQSMKNYTTLVFIGSCRHEEDYDRVKSLKSVGSELGIEKNVEFKVNVTFEEILQEMQNADVSLHTMWNEHFGIGIVECMSAGLIMIAHNSGGPKLDIVDNGKTGFLASDAESYADALEEVLRMDPERLFTMRQKARDSVSRFSVEKFENAFLKAIHLLFL